MNPITRRRNRLTFQQQNFSSEDDVMHHVRRLARIDTEVDRRLDELKDTDEDLRLSRQRNKRLQRRVIELEQSLRDIASSYGWLYTTTNVLLRNIQLDPDNVPELLLLQQLRSKLEAEWTAVTAKT